MTMGSTCDGSAEAGYDQFRLVERFYRLKGNTTKNPRKKLKTVGTDFSNVLDLTNIENNTPENKALISVQKLDKPCTSKFFSPIQAVTTISSLPGLLFIPCPFSTDQQKYWINKCTKEYTVGNPTNVSNLKNNTNMYTEWNSDIMETLRWVSLGYHYQWTPRTYEDDKRSAFPTELNELVKDLAATAGATMDSEAAIINFYPNPKCQMGAHRDDAEDDMSKPIVSVSFGNTVVFLMGDTTKEVKPTALFIRSGDVVIMGGHSRYCYHAIPRMIEGTTPPELLNTDDPNWMDCKNYLENARINMNCRQVRIKKEGDDKTEKMEVEQEKLPENNKQEQKFEIKKDQKGDTVVPMEITQ